MREERTRERLQKNVLLIAAAVYLLVIAMIVAIEITMIMLLIRRLVQE